MLQLILILCLVESAGGSPMDNVFWQYANWTAKQYTNDSCYVCHLMPSSVDKHSMITAPQNLSATLQAYGLTQVWNQLEVTHYRLATFTNATRAALQGVKDELTALRLTTVQNRMALDLLLAKEGGVCAMVGDSCCTYIPANDEDHGAISVALDRMQRVSTQLQLDEHGGCLMERVYALASSLNPLRSEYVVMSAMHPTGTPP
ncbi:hypothetical protein MHYP_G00309760 [Metynnis hypsauchen]